MSRHDRQSNKPRNNNNNNNNNNNKVLEIKKTKVMIGRILKEFK